MADQIAEPPIIVHDGRDWWYEGGCQRLKYDSNNTIVADGHAKIAHHIRPP